MNAVLCSICSFVSQLGDEQEMKAMANVGLP